jgi:hypothetical protein
MGTGMYKKYSLALFISAVVLAFLVSWQELTLNLVVNYFNIQVLKSLFLGEESASFLNFPLLTSGRLKTTMTSVEKLNERVWNLQPLLVDDGDGFQPNYLQTPAKMLEGWQLTAYGLDELALRQGKPNVPVVFRGQAAESGNAQGQWDGWSWSLDGMDFVITGTTPSLIWNSGFELPIANALIPSGFRDLGGDPKTQKCFIHSTFSYAKKSGMVGVQKLLPSRLAKNLL